MDGLQRWGGSVSMIFRRRGSISIYHVMLCYVVSYLTFKQPMQVAYV